MFNLDEVIDTTAIETTAKPERVRAGGPRRSQAQAALNQGLHAGFWRKACQAWLSDTEQPCLTMAPEVLKPALLAAAQMVDAEYPVKHGEKLSSLAMRTWWDSETDEEGKGINALIGQLNGYRPDSFAVLALRCFRRDNGKVSLVIHEQSKKTKALRERLGVSKAAGDEEFEQAIAAKAAEEWDLIEDYATGKLDATPKRITNTDGVTVRQ